MAPYRCLGSISPQLNDGEGWKCAGVGVRRDVRSNGYETYTQAGAPRSLIDNETFIPISAWRVRGVMPFPNEDNYFPRAEFWPIIASWVPRASATLYNKKVEPEKKHLDENRPWIRLLVTVIVHLTYDKVVSKETSGPNVQHVDG
jgi:hypothetical protein